MLDTVSHMRKLCISDLRNTKTWGKDMTVSLRTVAAIRRAAKAAGFTSQQELAKKSGLRPATISKLLTRQNGVRFATLKRIAHACKCRIVDLIDE